MAIKLTDKLIEEVNSAMADRDPHGILYLRKGAFGDTEIVFGDHYIADINGLWTLYRQLGIVVTTLREDIGIYEEA